jgi:hypothetical protein
MDVCSLLGEEEVGLFLRTQQPPKATPGSDEVGPRCQWPIQGSGVELQVQKDSDTRDPWAMTPETARTLFANQRRWWDTHDKLDWTWPEIGTKASVPVTRTPVRTIAGVGEEAFAFELKGGTGRIHTAIVHYRLSNLVVFVGYTALSERLGDEDIKQAAVKAAQATERALRHAG